MTLYRPCLSPGSTFYSSCFEISCNPGILVVNVLSYTFLK